MRRAKLAAVFMAAAITVTGCGIQVDDVPRPIPSDEIPDELLTPSTTEPPDSGATETIMAALYMVDGDRLVPVERQVVAPLTVGTLLAALMQGPTDEESGQGLRSAVIPQASIIGVQSLGATAVVNVADEFRTIPAQDQIRALAQIVYTATEVDGVDAVQIQVDQTPAEVPRGDGSVTSDGLTRSDYGSFAPMG